MKNTIIITTAIFTGLFVGTIDASAAGTGTLYPTSQPGESMYSLEEIYDLAISSATSTVGNGSEINVPSNTSEGSKITLVDLYNAIHSNSDSTGAGNLNPTSQPGETMYSLEEIYNLITASTTSTVGDGSEINVPEDPSEGSDISLLDIYGALLNLVNDKDEEPKGTDPSDGTDITLGLPKITSFLDTYQSARFIFEFTVNALDQTIFIPKIFNVAQVKINGLPATTVVPNTTVLFTNSTANEEVDGYYKINTGTSGTFKSIVNIDNTGGTPVSVKTGISGIEYKVGATNWPIHTYTTDSTFESGQTFDLKN